MLETLFSIVNTLAALGWIGLVIAATIKPSKVRQLVLLVSGRWVPILLCIAYLGFLVQFWGTAPDGGFQTLQAVQNLFASPGVLLAGWTHYLAFDLFVGRWIVDDALTPSRSRIPLIWSLPMTFLFGPVGVLVYLVSRLAFTRRSSASESPVA
jgi:hypothetical protein